MYMLNMKYIKFVFIFNNGTWSNVIIMSNQEPKCVALFKERYNDHQNKCDTG